MKKRKISMCMLSLFALFLSLNITYGKYDVHIVGEAWKTAFTTFSIIKDTYVLLDEDLILNSETNKLEGKSDSFWGTEGDTTGNSFTMNTLQNVEFSIQNMSSKRVKMMFEIIYETALGGISDLIVGDSTIVVKNTTTNQELSAVASVNSGKDIIISSDDSNRISIFDPENLATTSEKQAIFEKSFIVDTNEAFSYNINVSNNGSIWTEYVTVKMYVQEF